MTPFIETLKNKIDKFVSGGKPVMRICMLGGRGVGKSSILTAIYKSMKKAVLDSGLMLVAENSTENQLDAKYSELESMFYDINTPGARPKAGISGDFNVNTYSFILGVKNSNTKIDLQIKDYPGEFIEKEPDTVKSFIQESNCIIIAIDTPHLMEEDGQYNEGINFTNKITSFFEDTYKKDDGNKLVLFVPLKCEKYYHEGRISDVSAKVKEVYSPLISFFEENYKHEMGCAITPILTVGEVVFDDFLRDENGAVKLLQQRGIPAQALYKFRSMSSSYSPKYCEQPLFYLLSFVIKQHASQKRNATFWQRFSSLFDLFSKDSAFLLEMSKLSKNKICDKEGFVSIIGKNKF